MKDKKFEHLSAKEQAESLVFPHGLSVAEKAAADAELKQMRMLRLGQMSDTQRMYAELLRLKYQIENYLKYGKYEDQYSFGAFLRKYLAVLGRKQNVFAQEIDLHTSKLNQLLNDKVDVNIALVYRLEKHSGGIIPATDWWNLHAKKIEARILNDHGARLVEEEKVKYGLDFS
jgi:plasmid maintenance system antidote protein VapI